MTDSSKTQPKTNFTCRLNPDVLDRMRTFIRDHAGKPLYLRTGTFVEQAIIEHLQRLENQLHVKSEKGKK